MIITSIVEALRRAFNAASDVSQEVMDYEAIMARMMSAARHVEVTSGQPPAPPEGPRNAAGRGRHDATPAP